MKQQTHNVLFIQSDPENKNIAFHSLFDPMKSGLNIIFSLNLENGLKLIKEKKIDIVCVNTSSDIQECSNILTKINETEPGLPIILLSDFESEKSLLEETAPLVTDHILNRDLSTSLLRRSILYAIEKKQKEKLSRVSEQKLNLVGDNIQDVIWICDAEYNCTFISSSVKSLLGYDPQKMIGLPIILINPPEDRKAASKNLRYHKKIWEKNKSYTVNAQELRHLHIDGSKVWVEIKGNFIEDEYGNFAGITGVTRDITESKKEKDRLSKINECLMENSLDYYENIDRLTALAGEMLGATCALYNRLDKGQLCSLGKWNTPTGFNPTDKPDGHICYDVINESSDSTFFVNDLLNTKYAETDPNVSKYSLETYMGKAVKCGKQHVGSLCVVFQTNFFPSESDKRTLGIIASAISAEENRKKAENELISYRKKLAMHIEQTPLAVIEWDMDFRVAAWNPAAHTIFGFSCEEAIGKHGAEIIFLDERTEDIDRVWKDFISLKGGHGTENENITKDGRIINCDWYNTPLIDADGNILGVISLAQDITQRKSAEVERTRLATAIEQSSDGIIILDFLGKAKYANPAFCRILNSTPERVLGGDSYKYLFEKVEQETLDELQATILSGNTWKGRLSFINHDGVKLDLDFTTSPVRDDNDRIVNFVSVLRDITKEVDLEKKLAQSQKMESIGTLASGIAHDFNNILYAIIGYTELTLLNLPQNDSARENLNEVLKASSRASGVVDQILAFSRQTETEKESIKLQNMIDESIKLIRASLPTTIEIEMDVDYECGPIMANSTQIHQILMNLCTNAFQAMNDKGGVLSISLKEFSASYKNDVQNHPSGRYAKLSISDTGCGINEDLVGRIFEPYFTTKERGRGTGMGLAIVHGIVKAHGGFITVESDPGEGSIFNVLLPVIAPEPVLKSNEKNEQTKMIHKGRVLFVDDEEMITKVAKSLLKRLGYDVDTYNVSEKALEIFTKDPHAYDVVVTDLTMPCMKGTELAQKIHKIRQDIPIILSTGYIDEDHLSKIEETGIMELLIKPITSKSLSESIARVLKKSSPQKEKKPTNIFSIVRKKTAY